MRHHHNLWSLPISDFLINEAITAKTVRIVDASNKNLGEFSLQEAIRMAYSESLDLIVVAEGDIPVCRILDGDHYRFEKKKAEKDAAKRQRELTVETKELQLRAVTTDNDLAIKARKAREFLDQGDKVKVIVKMKGREKSHKYQGHDIIRKLLEIVGEHKIEKPAYDVDDGVLLILSPVVSKSEVQKKKAKA